MKAVLQRVFSASCEVDGECTGKCEFGLLILLGVGQGDDEEDARLLAEKISKCRIFIDDDDKMNLSLIDIVGSALVISNFTLCADYHHGNRPGFFDAEKPERANELYMRFCEMLEQRLGGRVGRGRFGAEMHIDAKLAGPVTIIMESEVLRKKK